MITLEVISPKNAPSFKDGRLRALQDSPNAFSSSYDDESRFTDTDWLKRATQWSGAKTVGYLAMDTATAVGITAGSLHRNRSLMADRTSMRLAHSAVPDQKRHYRSIFLYASWFSCHTHMACKV